MSLRTYAVERDPFISRAFFPVFSKDDLTGPEGVERLFAVRSAEEANGVALNTAFPDVEERYRAFVGHLIRPEKRLNVVGLGDVGGTLVTALKLLGDGIREIGVYDPNEALCRRYEMELNQVLDREKPLVRILHEDELFDCDAFLFTASRGVPPLGAAGDVRMLQFEKNRDMLKAYTKKAREAHFSGLFCQISDPVDQLSRCAFLQSNRDEAGDYDFKGLLPEQVAGFGLGVMKARAAYMARRLGVDEGGGPGPGLQALHCAGHLLRGPVHPVPAAGRRIPRRHPHGRRLFWLRQPHDPGGQRDPGGGAASRSEGSSSGRLG